MIGDDWLVLDGYGDIPDLMRQTKFLLCTCGKCFFFLHGVITGIVYKGEKVA